MEGEGGNDGMGGKGGWIGCNERLHGMEKEGGGDEGSGWRELRVGVERMEGRRGRGIVR